MKLVNLIITALFVLTASQLKAQKDLTIEYVQTINIHKSLSGSQLAMKAFIPESIEKRLVYMYKDQKARLKEVKDKIKREGIQMQISGSSSNALIDYKTKTEYAYYKIMNQDFHVESKIEETTFVFDTETKDILGHQCTKATLKDSKEKNIYWIARDISVKASPISQLISTQGAILAVDGDIVSCMAKSINETTLSPTELLVPLKTRKINQEQLEDLQEEEREQEEIINLKSKADETRN